MPTPAQGYAGDVTPTEAYEMVRSGARLVDCRTHAEWVYVGVPDLSAIESQLVTIEWVSYPTGQVNPHFGRQLVGALGEPADQEVVFLCRSGVRSVAAARAATELGFTKSYNILHGFQGPLDPAGHRDVRGWQVDGLPWRQG